MTNTKATVTPIEAPTKRCYRCETTKAVEDFCGDKTRADGLQPICRMCARAVREARKATHPGEQRRSYAKWYANPENARKANLRTANRNRERADLLIAQFKTKPCMDCGNSFPTCCMDFDHRPGVEKLFELKFKNFACKPLEVIVDEIAKCDLVCANCHRVRTVARNQTGRKAQH